MIETDFANRIPLHIQQTFRRVKSIEREAEIVKAVKLSKAEGGVIVFANHMTETFHISRLLDMYNISHVRLDKGKLVKFIFPYNHKYSETCRDISINDAIDDFNMGRIKVIVATDIISRDSGHSRFFPTYFKVHEL